MTRRIFILLSLCLTACAGGLFGQETNASAAPSAPSALDKNALQLMVRNNIFDPTRTGFRRRQRPPRVETFTFCGGAFDGPRAAAFFTGNGAPRRPLKTGDSINGFKISDITFRSVKLKPSDGAEITLAPGASMRKTENGPWRATDEAAPETASTTETNAPVSTISPNDSDIIKKLKAKRERN